MYLLEAVSTFPEKFLPFLSFFLIALIPMYLIFEYGNMELHVCIFKNFTRETSQKNGKCFSREFCFHKIKQFKNPQSIYAKNRLKIDVRKFN